MECAAITHLYNEDTMLTTEQKMSFPRYCESENTQINGVSIHWVDVANGNPNVLYQRQYSKNGQVGKEVKYIQGLTDCNPLIWGVTFF